MFYCEVERVHQTESLHLRICYFPHLPSLPPHQYQLWEWQERALICTDKLAALAQNAYFQQTQSIRYSQFGDGGLGHCLSSPSSTYACISFLNNYGVCRLNPDEARNISKFIRMSHSLCWHGNWSLRGMKWHVKVTSTTTRVEALLSLGNPPGLCLLLLLNACPWGWFIVAFTSLSLYSNDNGEFLEGKFYVYYFQCSGPKTVIIWFPTNTD